MVEIYIDGERCDVAVGYKLPKNIFTYDGGAMAKASQLQSGRRVELRLPSTPRNDVIMCHAGDPTAEPFNEREHEAVVAVDGGELLRGVVHLLGIEANDGAAEYIVVTEAGILAEMEKKLPTKRFIPAPSSCGKRCNECDSMKMITLESIIKCLENESPTIELDEETRQKASRSIEAMVKVG